MIKIIAGGRKSRGFVAEGVEEYARRLSGRFALEWRFVDDDKVDAAVAGLGADEFVILLDERGKNISSTELAEKIAGSMESGKRVVFVIGGAFGVNDVTRGRADFVWSLSRAVFPHELVRIIVAEQIYRARQILAGHPYHHE
jgi:23S rRNA (pseudouridine1915-N3)-methyltransferase